MGTTIDRNITKSSKKLSPRTNGNTTNSASDAISTNSRLLAVSPPTSACAGTPANASGM